MNQYLSSSSLKAQARGQLLGKYGVTVGAYLLHLLCVIPVTMAVTFVVGSNTLIGTLLSAAGSFLVSLFAGFFLAGQSYIYLKVACSQMPVITDLFHCFQGDTSRVIYIQAVIAGITTVAALPASIAGTFLISSLAAGPLLRGSAESISMPGGSLFLLYVILYLAGTVITVYARLLFSQVYYLMLDFPEYSAPQLLQMSIRLMKGNMGRLFYIQLSFFPLIMLSMLSCGVALFLLLPYMEATAANFYLDLIKKSKSQAAEAAL